VSVCVCDKSKYKRRPSPQHQGPDQPRGKEASRPASRQPCQCATHLHGDVGGIQGDGEGGVGKLVTLFFVCLSCVTIGVG